MNYEGRGIGPLKFEGDTALQFRRDVMQPFLDQYLKDGAPAAHTPPVFAYRVRKQRMAATRSLATLLRQRLPRSHSSTVSRAAVRPRICRVADGASPEFDEYVSDPAKPVPYIPRPVRFQDSDTWKRWLVMDQRAVADRTDVLTYTSEVLDQPLQISGAPIANLFASTSGTDSDWVVKLIDVYPDEVPSHPELGGYQLGLAMDIFRGRYRNGIEHPAGDSGGPG